MNFMYLNFKRELIEYEIKHSLFFLNLRYDNFSIIGKVVVDRINKTLGCNLCR